MDSFLLILPCSHLQIFHAGSFLVFKLAKVKTVTMAAAVTCGMFNAVIVVKTMWTVKNTYFSHFNTTNTTAK